MRSPRRIFRASAKPRPHVLRTILLGFLIALGGVGLVSIAVSTDLFGRAPPGPDHIAAEPEHVAVIDGDTLRLGGTVIRLNGIEAPERGDTCRGGKDCGGAATLALAGLVRDRRVDCRLNGEDHAGRPYGNCKVDGTDLSRAVVASGWARARPGAPDLADLELRARRQRAGLWADVAGR